MTAEEARIVKRIAEARHRGERDEAIAELEALPGKQRSFSDHWMTTHSARDAIDSWTDGGFDPGRSPEPRDVQLLAAMEYGVADILNGGLHQFFGNTTGSCAPEMVEWCQRTGLQRFATILSEAMRYFGSDYPRAQYVRQQISDAKEHPRTGPRSDWDPFATLDDQLFDWLEQGDYERAKEKWLRETCGIKRLSDRPEGSDPAQADARMNPASRANLDSIRRHGFATLAFSGQPGCPPFVHTMGIHRSFSRPEATIVGLPVESSYPLLREYVRRSKERHAFTDGELCSDFCDGRAIVIRQVGFHSYRWMRWNRWYYDGPFFQAVQLIYQDDAGRWPWEPEVDAVSLKYQCGLQHSGWAGHLPPEQYATWVD